MRLRVGVAGVVLLGSLAAFAWAQESSAPAPENRIELVKTSLATSKATLKSFEWIETVALSLSGSEKVRQQYRCYHGADGKLQKVPVAADAKEDKKRGVRGKVADNKKAELEASLKAAVQLLHQYSPVDPAKVEAAKKAGNVSVSVPDAQGMITVTVKGYLKPGDELGMVVDGNKNTLQSASVSSFTGEGDKKSPVTAKMTYAALEDGTMYPAKEDLEIPAQSLKVAVENSGYRKHTS